MSTGQPESTYTNGASKQGGATALTDETDGASKQGGATEPTEEMPVVPTRTWSKKGGADAPELDGVVSCDTSRRYLSVRLAFLWHRRALRAAESNSSPFPASSGYALQRCEALALCHGWHEQVDDAEDVEIAGYTFSYPSWLAPAAQAVDQSQPPRGPHRLSPARCRDSEPDGLAAAERPLTQAGPHPPSPGSMLDSVSAGSSPPSPLAQVGPRQPLPGSMLNDAPAGSPPPSPPYSPPELTATSDSEARDRARSSLVLFASELTAALASLAAVRNGLIPFSAPQTKRTATHAAAGKARAAAGRMLAVVPIHVWAALDAAYRLRRRAASSPAAAARRAASARRERTLALRASPPQPMISYDVGSVDGEILYRSDLGVVSKLHPMSGKLLIASALPSLRMDRQPLRHCPQMVALFASAQTGPEQSATMMRAVGWPVGTYRPGLLGLEPSLSRACSFCLVQPLPLLSLRPVSPLGWVSIHCEALRGCLFSRTARAKCSCSIPRQAVCVQPHGSVCGPPMAACSLSI